MKEKLKQIDRPMTNGESGYCMFEKRKYEERGWKYGSMMDYQLRLHRLCLTILKEIEYSESIEEETIWKKELERIVDLRDGVENRRMELQGVIV